MATSQVENSRIGFFAALAAAPSALRSTASGRIFSHSRLEGPVSRCRAQRARCSALGRSQARQRVQRRQNTDAIMAPNLRWLRWRCPTARHRPSQSVNCAPHEESLIIATRESRWHSPSPSRQGRTGKCNSRSRRQPAGHDHPGDQILDKPLAKVGGRGCSSRNLKSPAGWPRASCRAFAQGCADGAAKGFALAAILPREDARDAFVSSRYESLAAMPAGGGGHLQFAPCGRAQTPTDARFQAGARQRQHPPRQARRRRVRCHHSRRRWPGPAGFQ